MDFQTMYFIVERIDGDYANVVGFPVSRLARELANMVK